MSEYEKKNTRSDFFSYIGVSFNKVSDFIADKWLPFIGAHVLGIVQILDNFAEDLLGLFVQVGDGNTSSQKCVIRVLGCHRSGSFGSQVIQLNG